MDNSKLGKNRAGKISVYRGKTVFWNHCKRSLEAVFSNMVSAGDGLQKRKGVNNRFVISLPPSPWRVPTSSQSLWDSTKALRQERRRSLPKKSPACQKVTVLLLQLSPFAPQEICLLREVGAMTHMQSWATPQPPTSSPHWQDTHLPPSCTAKQNGGQHLPTVVVRGKWMSHRPFLMGANSQICL